MATGAELFCKNIMLLMYNVLAVLLMRSSIEEVRMMTPWRVQQLLLERSFIACTSKREMTLLIEPVPTPHERALQNELVRLVNEKSPTLHGKPLALRISDPPAKTRLLRFSG